MGLIIKLYSFLKIFSQLLCSKDIPAWVNRIANIGSRLPWVYNCLPKDWLTPEPEMSESYNPMFNPEQRHNNFNCKFISSFNVWITGMLLIYKISHFHQYLYIIFETSLTILIVEYNNNS